MNKIIRNRGEGKTTELIKRSALTEYPILVISERYKRNIQEKAREIGEFIPEPIIFRAMGYRGLNFSKVLIDEADEFLRYILLDKCGLDIDSITLSPNEEENEHMKLRKAAQPLVDYIRENYDPHTTILVENDFVRVVRDDLGVPFDIK